MPTPLRFRVVTVAVLTALVALLVISASSSSAAISYSSHLRRYPYLTDVVDSYATVNWGTDNSLSTGAIRYGAVGSESCTAHYVPATRHSITVNTVPEYQWSAMLNVAPGQQYCYRVYQGSSSSTQVDLLGSDPSPSFWTQIPAGSTQPYSFAVFGDWGYVDSNGLNPYQASLMSLVANSSARFAVTVGDNSYPTGNQDNYGDLVQTGNGISGVFGPQFWKVAGSFMPIFPATGNHGLLISGPLHPLLLNFPQTQAVALSGGRYMKDTYCCLDGTSTADYASAWYAFDAGLARIYVLDVAWSESNVGTASSPYQVDYDYHWTTTSPEYQWLQSDLASHPSVLKFAFWHYPLYTDDNNIPSDTYLQGTGSLEGLLKQYGVNIAFTGHTHTYERNIASPSGLPSYVNGGGGGVLNTLGPCLSPYDAYAISFNPTGKSCGNPLPPPPTSADQVYHFNLVTVNGTQVTVSPKNSLGQTFDVQNYDFSAGSETVPPSIPANLTATAVDGTQVNIAWSAASDNTGVRGYDVYRDGVLITTTDVSVRNYSDTGPVPNTSYSYAVDAFDAFGNHSPLSASAAVTTPATATYTFTAVADSYVRSDASATNYGLANFLITDGSPDVHSFLRFRVADTAGAVTKATLRLYATSASGAGYDVQAVTDHTWDENTITYANAPALGSPANTSPAFSSTGWVSVDVTSLIAGNGLYDFAVSTSSNNSETYSSRDAASNWPELVIQTNSLPPTSTPTSTATPTSTPTSTPTVTPTVVVFSDPIISGNVGVAFGTLHYSDGTARTATADANGKYSFTVSYGWSGTVTPSLAGYAFTPASATYANLTSNSSAQNYTAHALSTSVFRSAAAYDGWVVESGETTNIGGSANSTDVTVRLGDNASRGQYRSILSFMTSGLPDNAVITSATLKLTKQSITPPGTHPFTIFQGLLIDMQNGYFGTSAGLQPVDFQAPAAKARLSPPAMSIASGVYTISLPSAAFPYINLSTASSGLTQLRLRFTLDDNNDSTANYISFYSGNDATVTYRPALTIRYYLP